MKEKETKEKPQKPVCPRCGNRNISTMAELRALVVSPTSEFSPDLASWLSPPKKPDRQISRRHRTGLRNGISFGMVWTITNCVAYFALTGRFPNPFFLIPVLAIGGVIAYRTWKNESVLAAKEDKLLLATHFERYRAYLQRRKVWSRMRYCSRCGLVIDPMTMRDTSLYEIHELANGSVNGVTLL